MASRLLINASRDKEEVFLDLLAEQENRLGRTLTKIEVEAIGLANQLEVQGGLIISSQTNLDLALKSRADLVRIFQEEYNIKYITPTVNEFDKMAVGAKDYLTAVGIDVPFTGVDRDIINALKQGAFVNLDVLGMEFQNKLADSIFLATLGNDSFNDLVKNIKGSLVSVEDVAGKPMSSRAEQIAHDSLINIDRSVLTKKSNDARIDKFQYFGSLVRDSRDFCVQHTGEIRTKKEWDDIGQGSWQGKSGSDLFATAGGYNCGHFLNPVPNEEL